MEGQEKSSKRKKLKLIISAGGTAGHLFPAVDFATLVSQRRDIVFIGHGLNSSPYFKKELFPFHEITAAPLGWLFIPKLLKGVFESIKILRKEKPDEIIGFGSYHTFPLLIASLLLRKKLFLFEANRTLGKVNAFFKPFSTLLSQFPIQGVEPVLTPLLPWKKKASWGKKEARDHYQLDPDRRTVLVFGGSQGAKFLNEEIPPILNELDVQVLHFGLDSSPYKVPSCVKKFEHSMEIAFAAADLVIARSGAGTISELLLYKIPSILIPYPFAYGHQEDNALYLSSIGGAKVIKQADFSKEVFLKTFQNLDLKEMSLALSRADQQNRKSFEELFP
jgi:UDP-N-acetylglucosamine--N-acetylmuramyl-(pentapeptide) pyrophosphoryl-undecaprenol N-acetylglucosamine transferase